MPTAPAQPDGPNSIAGLIDIDLAEWPPKLEGTAGHSRVMALIRWAGAPLGTLDFDSKAEPLTPALIWQRASEQLTQPLLEAITRHVLKPATSTEQEGRHPVATLVICTRDRPDDLRRCLEWVQAHTVAPLELVVVDNAPARFPVEAAARSFGARYVVEPRVGLNRARQRGAIAAQGDIIIYIDDDVAVAPGWERALLSSFDDPEVAGVTGLVLPFELTTSAQLLFEQHCGFSRGYQRQEYTLTSGSPIGAARVGAGACMAFRRELVTGLGLFTAEMDAGTPTLSGGDTYAFYQLLSLGYRLVYEPLAVVRHRHRTSLRELQRTLYGYSVGTYCYLLRCLLRHREANALPAGLRWFLDHHLRRLAKGIARQPGVQPLALTASEIAGVLMAPLAYIHASIRERRG